MLQDPISMYEDARRRHLERLAEGSRRRVLREHAGQGLRRAVAAMLRRAADAVDGGTPAWGPGGPIEDAWPAVFHKFLR